MDISYTLIRSRRKTIAIQLTPAGEVLVRCPQRMPEKQVRSFVEEKRGWIEKHLKKLEAHPALPPFSQEELRALGRELAPRLSERTAHFASLLGASWGRITVRCQHTRWGSCSSQGNLSFNCLLALVPPEVLDYVVVHELCHRLHMDHSPAFWEEVAGILPDYKSRKQWLKENGTALLARLPE